MTNYTPAPTPAKVIVNELWKQTPTADEILMAGINQLRASPPADVPECDRLMAKAVAMLNLLLGTELTEANGWRLLELLEMVRAEQTEYEAATYQNGATYCAMAGEAAALADQKKPKKPTIK